MGGEMTALYLFLRMGKPFLRQGLLCAAYGGRMVGIQAGSKGISMGN
jgi:hypothetical protein